jgi:hypothetical protein
MLDATKVTRTIETALGRVHAGKIERAHVYSVRKRLYRF